MIKSIGTLASESLGVRKRHFSDVTNLPAVSAGRFTPLAAHSANNAAWLVRRCVLNCKYEGRHPQRAGIALPHAEGEELSRVTCDGEAFAFISTPAGVVGGVPLIRARNPWAMPEAST